MPFSRANFTVASKPLRMDHWTRLVLAVIWQRAGMLAVLCLERWLVQAGLACTGIGGDTCLPSTAAWRVSSVPTSSCTPWCGARAHCRPSLAQHHSQHTVLPVRRWSRWYREIVCVYCESHERVLFGRAERFHV
jgi:hypothetical protein